ncbi:MAG: rhomboid family intramembrane serine protease [Clostridiales bacterium]|nr:rhomboid family intramembrane serine protease [Clostridiales bacterium]
MSSKGRFGNFIKSIPKKITINAPVTLGFIALCVLVQLLSEIIPGDSLKTDLFAVRRGSWGDPLTYLRLFTHTVGHRDWSHLANNMLYILLLGPILEEKHGKKNILLAMLITALVTGLYAVIVNKAMYGASGIVFAFILMVSFTGIRKEHTINLTTILVILVYIGEQIYLAITQPDSGTAYGAHIIGGIVGGIIGYLLETKKKSSC